MHSLVSTEWLANNLGAGNFIVLDASRHLPASGRDGAAEFRGAHIPGARFLDLAALDQPRSGIGAKLPGPERAATMFSVLGLDRDKTVVLYDDSDIRTSARAWYILRGYGFGTVGVLDGGLAKRKAENRPLESGAGSVAPAPFESQTFAGNVRNKRDMLDNVESRNEQVVDARDAGRFTGDNADTVHDLPGGHIPGARNLFFRDLFADDGTYLPADELGQRFARAGLDLDEPVVATCGSGVTASVLLFALHLIGKTDTALYDGSWAEWGADPATPKETGTA